METHKEHKKGSFKTNLIRTSGGYGGFKQIFGKDPFQTSESEAKRLFQKNFGRNSLCPCGQGKKFKRCCLK
tara:strand:- start:754 stop:966 length:213 start_codon:yes stop_codon:yes gene_type:complete